MPLSVIGVHRQTFHTLRLLVDRMVISPSDVWKTPSQFVRTPHELDVEDINGDQPLGNKRRAPNRYDDVETWKGLILAVISVQLHCVFSVRFVV